VSLLSAIVTARLYGVVTIGEFTLAYAPTAFVWLLSSVREQPALLRALAVLNPRAEMVTGLFLAVFTFSQCLTGVVVVITIAISYVVFLGPLHHPELFAPAAVMLSGYLLLANPGWNIDTVLSGFRAGAQLSSVRLNQATTFLVSALALYFVSNNYWGLAAAMILSYATSLIHRLLAVQDYMVFRVGKEPLRRGFRELPSMLRFGLKLTPGTLASGASSQAGTWILAFLTPVASVGSWSRALALSTRFEELHIRITDILLPTLVGRRADNDEAGFARAAVDSMRYMSLMLLLPAAVTGGAASRVMSVLFGPSFSEASGALAVLVLFPVVRGLTVFQTQVLVAVERPLATSVLESLRLAVTLILGVVLTREFQATGMAAAMVFACALEVAINMRFVRRHLATPIAELWPLGSRLAAVGAYCAAFAASRFATWSVPGVIGLLVAIVSGSLAFLVVLAACGGLLERDRRRIASMLEVRRAWVSRSLGKG
jgi:O-antigen/teichoic acid export membrane protein